MNPRPRKPTTSFATARSRPPSTSNPRPAESRNSTKKSPPADRPGLHPPSRAPRIPQPEKFQPRPARQCTRPPAAPRPPARKPIPPWPPNAQNSSPPSTTSSKNASNPASNPSPPALKKPPPTRPGQRRKATHPHQGPPAVSRTSRARRAARRTARSETLQGGFAGCESSACSAAFLWARVGSESSLGFSSRSKISSMGARSSATRFSSRSTRSASFAFLAA